jgi:hypothetical protein
MGTILLVILIISLFATIPVWRLRAQAGRVATLVVAVLLGLVVLLLRTGILPLL